PVHHPHLRGRPALRGEELRARDDDHRAARPARRDVEPVGIVQELHAARRVLAPNRLETAWCVAPTLPRLLRWLLVDGPEPAAVAKRAEMAARGVPAGRRTAPRAPRRARR